MFRKSSILLTGAAMLSLIGTAHGHELIIASHYGNTDPVDQGWELDDGTDGTNAPDSYPGSEGGVDYWEIIDPVDWENEAGRRYRYQQDLDPSHFEGNWRVSATVQLLDMSSEIVANAVIFRLDTQDKRWELTLGGGDNVDNPGIYYNAASGWGYLHEMDPTAGFIRYDLIYNASDDAAKIYVDGLEVGTLTSDDVRVASGTGIEWGSINHNEKMHARYSLVEFAIPEPGTAALVMGSLGLMALRRRRHA